MRLIDGDRLEDVLKDLCSDYSGESDFNVGIQNGLLLARDIVQEAPTIDADVKHGKWKCTLCKNRFELPYGSCPFCGRKLVEVEE